jgi:hypothetical protein
MTSECLAVAALVCLFLGNLALWMRQDVYSVGNIEGEAQQILRSSDVRGAVADLLTTRVVQPAVGQAGLGPFSGLVKAPVTSMVRRLVDRAMAAQPTQDVAARLVEQVAPELERGTGPISLSPEQLTWILSPSLAANRMVATVLNTADRTGCCAVVLAQRQSLSLPWRHVREVRIAGLVFPALFAGFVVFGLALARHRRRLATVMAAAAAIGGLATVALLWAGPQFWAGLVSRSGAAGGIVRAVDRAVFNSATSGLRQHSLVVAAVGAMALVVLACSRIRHSRGMRAADGHRLTQPG